jgi:hypothetical protein
MLLSGNYSQRAAGRQFWMQLQRSGRLASTQARTMLSFALPAAAPV